MNAAQWAAVTVVLAVTLGGVWAYTAGDRRVATGFAGIALLGAICLSISLWGPHADEQNRAPRGWQTAPLKP